jgi:hypothetical protein
MSNNWKKRLVEYEQTPPKGVWENIAKKLDEANSWQNRVLHFEEVPPAGIWENIAAKLDKTENSFPITSVNHPAKTKLIWRFAVAASLISVLLLSVFYYHKKTVVDNNAIASTGTISSADSNLVSPITSEKVEKEIANTVIKPENNNQLVQLPKRNPVNKVNTDVEVAYVKGNEVPSLAGAPDLDKNKKLTNTDGETPNDISLMNSPNNYITITGPNGETVRVSSKFSKLVNYLSDKNPSAEEYLDKVIKESTFWKGKFKDWREKMINNSVTPAPTNFMDIIELSKVVREK